MNNSKAIVSALLLTLSAGSATLLYAAPDDASATNSSATDAQLQNRSVEDLVAIAKAGEANEAINDAV
ncbi:MAG: TPM domain-containing protein, partial [Psychrobacter sp.]